MDSSFCRKHFLFLGVHPDKPPNKWIYSLNMSLMACMIVFGGIKYFHDGQLDSVQTISGLVAIIIKYSTLFFGSKMITQILRARENFWKLDFTDDLLTFALNNYKLVDTIYRMSFTLGVTMFAVKPFIAKGSSIFNCYFFSEIPYPVYYVMELYVLVVTASTFMSFNVFICCLLTSVVVQFRYLNLKLAALKIEDVEDDQDLARLMQDLGSIIQYQQFLIGYVDELNNFLCVPLALLMGTSVTMACLSMYVVSTNQSILDAGKVLIIDFIIVIEFFMVYGLPAQSLMDESTATADTIYCEFKWYLPKLCSLRKDFLFMILRNQEGVSIRAGNYHVVNNQTIVLIVKTTYSFFTFMQNMA